jgi:hypothetical protein
MQATRGVRVLSSRHTGRLQLQLQLCTDHSDPMYTTQPQRNGGELTRERGLKSEVNVTIHADVNVNAIDAQIAALQAEKARIETMARREARRAEEKEREVLVRSTPSKKGELGRGLDWVGDLCSCTGNSSVAVHCSWSVWRASESMGLGAAPNGYFQAGSGSVQHLEV